MFDFKFDWLPNMATGIEEMDEQHKQLLSLGRNIEQLLQINCIGVTEKQLLDIVCSFRDFAGYHFYQEESLMKECAYPELSAHRKLHLDMVSIINQYDVHALSLDPVKKLEEAREILQDKIFGHMLTEDQKFARYYRNWKNHNGGTDAGKAMSVSGNADALEARYEKQGKLLAEFDMTRCYLLYNQYYRGHVLLVNKEEKYSLTQLATLERSTFFNELAKVASLIKKTLLPDALEYACFEDVQDKLSYHIVPKYRTDPDFGKPFDWEKMKKPEDAEFQELFEKLKAAFEKKK